MANGLINLQTDLKSLRYGSETPYVTKDINNPPSSEKIGMQASKRIDDTSRIVQMLISKPGLKYLANEALLKQASNLSKAEKAKKAKKSIAGAILSQIGDTFVSTVKIAGSTLAQVPVNGTGTHFLKGFKTDTYLQPTGGDRISKFAAFFGAGGVEGAPYALEGRPIEGKVGVDNQNFVQTSTTGRELELIPSQYSYDARVFEDRNETKNTPIVTRPQNGELNKSLASKGEIVPITTSELRPIVGKNADTDELTFLKGFKIPANNLVGVETTAKKGVLTRQNLIQSIPHTGSIAGDVNPDSSTNLISVSSSYNNTYTGKEAKTSITNAQAGKPIPVYPSGSTLRETSGDITGSQPTTDKNWLQGEQDNLNSGNQKYNEFNTYTGNNTENSVKNALEGSKIFINSGEKFTLGYLKTFSDYPTDGNSRVNVENLKDSKGKDVYPQGSSLGETSIPKIARLSKVAFQINTGSISTISQDSGNYNTTIQDFRSGSTETYSYDYNTKAVHKEQRINLGNQGIKKANYKSYMVRDPLAEDKLNAAPESPAPLEGADAGRDLAKFYFQIITPDNPTGTFLHFRAFIDSIDDSYSADWQARKYNGRAEDFYTYGGFTRDISVSFNIAAASRSEMNPLYRKMVYLASATAPTYGASGLMRGTLAKLTIGSYFSQIPGVITSVKYSVDSEIPWEIAMGNPDGGAGNKTDDDVQELPMMLKCTISFKPIHDFAPQTGLQHYFTAPKSKYGANPFF